MSERDLTNTQLGDAGLAALVASPDAAELTALAVGCNGLTDASCEAIARSPHLARLERLSLGDTMLKNPFAPSPADLRVVEHPYFAGYRFVERMDPAQNQITAAGIRALGEARLPALRELGLWALRIGPEGVRELVASPLFAQLKKLDLRNVKVDDALDRAGLGALEGIDLDHATTPLRGLPIYARVYGSRATSLHVDLPGDVAPWIPPFTALRALEIVKQVRASVLDGREALDRLRVNLAPGGAFTWPGLANIPELAVSGEVDLADLLPRLGAVRKLAITAARLTDAHLDPLLAWPGLARLEVLDLGDNQLTLAGLARVVDRAIELPELKRLELYGNGYDWRYDEWRDWDGSPLGGGDLVVSDTVRAVMRRLPSRIVIYVHDPR